MKDTLNYLVTTLVDEPKAVNIEETEEDGTTIFTINVDPKDMGKIIGKEGKVIRSIRNILKVQAMKENKRISVSLGEV